MIREYVVDTAGDICYHSEVIFILEGVTPDRRIRFMVREGDKRSFHSPVRPNFCIMCCQGHEISVRCIDP
jgi:hypothetical protein